MSTRISELCLAGLAMLLAGCSAEQTTNTQVLAKVESEQASAAEDDGRILCAHGDAAMTRDCTIEQANGEGGLVLTVRHGDGGFHRLLVTRDGRGVVAADGAEPAKVTIIGPGDIEVVIGGDRYRLPATVKGAQPAS